MKIYSLWEFLKVSSKHHYNIDERDEIRKRYIWSSKREDSDPEPAPGRPAVCYPRTDQEPGCHLLCPVFTVHQSMDHRSKLGFILLKLNLFPNRSEHMRTFFD